MTISAYRNHLKPLSIPETTKTNKQNKPKKKQKNELTGRQITANNYSTIKIYENRCLQKTKAFNYFCVTIYEIYDEYAMIYTLGFDDLLL